MDRPRITASLSNDRLLDFHLGRLDPDESRSLQSQLNASESLAARSQNLSAWLGLLQAYESPTPPPGLVDAIVNRVNGRPSLRLAAADSSLPQAIDGPNRTPARSGRAGAPSLSPATDAGGGGRRPIFAFRELIALAACLTFFVSLAIPGIARMRSASQRTMCSANMANIYQGLTQYAGIFNGSLPQTAGFVPGTAWWRPPTVSNASGAPRMSNSRNLFLIVRLGHAKPENFICPSDAPAASPAMIPLETLDDFPAEAPSGFDFQNMAGPTLRLGEGGPQPILADHNPLFDNKKASIPRSPHANSFSHGDAGQNVLTSDGQVIWMTTPIVPSRRDNIWQVEGIDRYEDYKGVEYQKRPDDTFLVP